MTTNRKWQIGDVTIHQLFEVEAGQTIQSAFANYEPTVAAKIPCLLPDFIHPTGAMKAQVQGFLIQSEGKNVIVDTCNGDDKQRTDIPEWGNLKTDFLQRLIGLGVQPEDIHVVLCTHLHMDHVGWNTRLVNGSWKPTFVNARYLITEDEYNYWCTIPSKEIDDDNAAFRDSVVPIVEAGLVDLVQPNYAIDGNVRLFPTHGHTPGHVSVRIQSKGAHAVITGDLLHHPCQVCHPEWRTGSDFNTNQAQKALVEFLEEAKDSDCLLLGSHFAYPVSVRVVTRNGRLEVASIY